MKTETFIEELECDITRRESANSGKELARQHQLLREHNVNAKFVKSEIATAGKKIESEIERLSRIVHTGKERRPIECYERPDARRFEIAIVRMDTGAELSCRAMDAVERKQSLQGDLFNFHQDVVGLATAASKARVSTDKLAKALRDSDATLEEHDADSVMHDQGEEGEEGEEGEDDPANDDTAAPPSSGPVSAGEEAVATLAADDGETTMTHGFAQEGTTVAPNPMPAAANLGPTDEDKENWAAKGK